MLNGDKAILISAASVAAAAGLFAGIVLGAWLGRLGALEILRAVMRLPFAVLRAPGSLVNRWKTWGEWRARRKIERIRFRNQIKELRGKIASYEGEIRKTRTEIRRTRWKFREPEPPRE